MATAAKQSLALAFGIGGVDIRKARMARPLLPKATGPFEG